MSKYDFTVPIDPSIYDETPLETASEPVEICNHQDYPYGEPPAMRCFLSAGHEGEHRYKDSNGKTIRHFFDLMREDPTARYPWMRDRKFLLLVDED